MADSPAAAPPSTAGRNIRRLGIAVVIIVVLYSAGWFYVASKFEDFLNGFIAPNGRGAVSLTCDNLSTGGFPFLIGFTCDKSGIDDPSTGDSMNSGAFRAAARVYNPGTAIVELESPADLNLGNGTRVAAQWDKLRSSFRAGFSGLSTLSLEGDAPRARIDMAELQAAFDLKAAQAQLHLRDNNGDLDVAVLARDFEWNDANGNAILPKLSTSADVSMFGKAAILKGRPFGSKVMEGELRAFKIETPDGLYGEMSGPFTIDDQGYITGTFQTTFEKISLWDEKLRGIFPDGEGTISGLAALLKGLAKGGDSVTVKLEIDEGRISLSMLPLGRIPPI
jgi:hypothetical protein